MSDPAGEATYVPLSELQTIDTVSLLPQGSQWECEPCATRFVLSARSPDCPYCALPLSECAGDESQPMFRPEGLLPFKVPFGEASESFQGWIKDQAGLMTPSDLVETAKPDRLVGVYLPHFLFRCQTTTDYAVVSVTKGGTSDRPTWHESGPHTGTIESAFVDLMVCANTALPAELVEALEPWDLDALQAYETDLAGEYTIESRGNHAALLEVGKERMKRTIESSIHGKVGGDYLDVRKLEVECKETKVRSFLFPLWIVSYRYKEQVYRVLVNARTGEVSGDHPTTGLKLFLLLLGAVALIGGIIVTVILLVRP